MTKYVRNILRVYRQATEEEVEGGLAWYPRSRSECQSIAADLSQPLSRVVGVVAALSPNNRWELNLRNARDLVEAHRSGRTMDSVKVCTYGLMKRKAWSILESDLVLDVDIERVLNGQKIVCFYQTIMGINTCTIDGHAYNIAHGKRLNLTSPKIKIGKGLYAELQDSYRRAGKRVGDLKAYETQAITWTAWRRIHSIERKASA